MLDITENFIKGFNQRYFFLMDFGTDHPMSNTY
jgi:hypothetical protein